MRKRGNHRTEPGRAGGRRGVGGGECLFKDARSWGSIPGRCLNARGMDLLAPGEKLGVVLLLHQMGVAPRTQAPPPQHRGNLTSESGCCLLPRAWVGGEGDGGSELDEEGQRLPLQPWHTH